MHVDIAALIRSYADHQGLSLSYASRKLAGSGDTIARLDCGGSLTMRRVTKILQTASDLWPQDLMWPRDIPRPAPSPDSPAAGAADEAAQKMQADPESEVARYRKAMSDAIDRHAWSAAEAIERKMHAAALALGEHGRIASPKALCLALHIERHVYDDVVRRYRAGVARGRPRPNTPTDKMLRALELSGDARFRAPGVAA